MPLEHPALSHIEKTFADAYRKEIDQEENIWRSLPFFAATLALQLAALFQVVPRLPPPETRTRLISGILLVLTGLFMFAALCLLAACIAPARFRYIPCSRENPKKGTAQTPVFSDFHRFDFPDFRVSGVYLAGTSAFPIHGRPDPSGASTRQSRGRRRNRRPDEPEKRTFPPVRRRCRPQSENQQAPGVASYVRWPGGDRLRSLDSSSGHGRAR